MTLSLGTLFLSAALILLPWISSTSQGADPDAYEPDDLRSAAHVILLNDTPQQHNFHQEGDADWVKFAAKASDEWYTLKAGNVGGRADVVLELYANTGANGPAIAVKNDGWEGEEEILNWKCPADGIYYLKVRNHDPAVWGDETDYELEFYQPIGPLSGTIVGYVTNALTAMPVPGATVTVDNRIPGLSLQDGAYMIIHPAGAFSITAQAQGYVQQGPFSVVVNEGGTTLQNFQLTPLPTQPTAVVLANGASGQVPVSSISPVQISISLNPGTQVLRSADWWFVQQTPAGALLYYDLYQARMVNGLGPTYQGPLFEFGLVPLVAFSSLTPGNHYFYFGVDLKPNGALDMDSLYFDYVLVSVGQ